MAENRRVRIEDDIETYLLSHAERVLGKNPDNLTTTDYSTLTNRLLYEHKLAQGITHQFPVNRLLDWLISLMAGTGKQISILPSPKSSLPQPEEPEDFSFDAQLGDLYEEAA
jgi:hypothetical protein